MATEEEDNSNEEGDMEERKKTTRRRSIGKVEQALKETFGCFNIPTNFDEWRFVHAKHGQESWRADILAFLHRRSVQYTLAVLLLLDVVLLFTELFLGAEYPHCHFIVRDAISCCPETSDDLRGLASDEKPICEPPLVETDNKAGCDSHKWDTVHTIEEVIFFMTVAILSIFMVELCLLMAALGPWKFFRHFFYVLDLFVVSVGLALEITFHVIGHDDLAAYVGFMVILRCWRFIRIGHGLMEIAAEVVSHKYVKVVELAEELEKALEEFEAKSEQFIDNGSDVPSWSANESLTSIKQKNKALIEAIHEANQE